MRKLKWTEEADDFLIRHALEGKKHKWIASQISTLFDMDVSESSAQKRIVSLLENGADQYESEHFNLHISPADAAPVWGFCKESLRRYVRDGLLPCVYEGQNVMIDIVAMDILAECRKLKGVDWNRFKSEMEELNCA